MWLLGSPGRDLFSQHRGFQFGAILGTDIFGDTPPPNIDQNPYPYSGLSQSLPGPHACLMDTSDPRPPDLCGHSCVRPLICSKIPISQFFRKSKLGPSCCLMQKSEDCVRLMLSAQITSAGPLVCNRHAGALGPSVMNKQ